MSNTRFAPKLKVKKGDKVVVISGASKGVEGNILEVFPKENRLIVEGVNVAKKHTKPSNDNPGGINEINRTIHVSNVMLVDPKTGAATKVGRRIEDNKIVRFSKKSGQTIK